jgi:hypothetical protein
MTRTVATLTTALVLSLATFTLSAKGNLTTLNDSDWTAIAEETEIEEMLYIEDIPVIKMEALPVNWSSIKAEAELEKMLDLEPIPAIKPIQQEALNLNLEKGKAATMQLNADFEESDEVGVVILNQNGDLIYAADGLFSNLKSLSFNPKFEKTANYVVRMFNADRIYETTLQVVNL